MPTVHELYELWAADSELRDALTRSLDPRGPDWLLDVFGTLGPKADDLLVDVGARDGKHSTELARRHGVRVVAAGIALHGVLLSEDRRKRERRYCRVLPGVFAPGRIGLISMWQF